MRTDCVKSSEPQSPYFSTTIFSPLFSTTILRTVLKILFWQIVAAAVVISRGIRLKAEGSCLNMYPQSSRPRPISKHPDRYWLVFWVWQISCPWSVGSSFDFEIFIMPVYLKDFVPKGWRRLKRRLRVTNLIILIISLPLNQWKMNQLQPYNILNSAQSPIPSPPQPIPPLLHIKNNLKKHRKGKEIPNRNRQTNQQHFSFVLRQCLLNALQRIVLSVLYRNQLGRGRFWRCFLARRFFISRLFFAPIYYIIIQFFFQFGI